MTRLISRSRQIGSAFLIAVKGTPTEVARITRSEGTPTFRFRKGAALFALGLAVVLAQMAGRAQSGAAPTNANPLPYSTGYLVTGNYAVASVDPGPNPGSVTQTIQMRGIPANADILAAFLYW